MPPTFYQDPGLLEKRIADQALVQLKRACVFPRVAMTNYAQELYNYGDTVVFRRAKNRIAQDIDPRSEKAIFAEAQYSSGEIKLEKLFVDPILSYKYDSTRTITKYVQETAAMFVDSITTANDAYMYSCFRTWNIPSSGIVNLGAHPPIAIAACVDAGGQLTKFNGNGLTAADTFLSQENVPASDRFACLSSSAKGAFLGDAIIATGFVAATIGGGQLMQSGLQVGNFVERYGFMMAGTNTISGQAAVADLDSAANNQGTLAISAVAPNTDFRYADFQSTTNVGAVNLTLTVTTALQNVAVGQIARIGTANKATAFGVILRVTGNVVTLVPYSPDGIKLLPAEITTGTDVFSIPRIPSVNTVNHREGLAMATRLNLQPSPGSGAISETAVDPDTGIAIQIYSGNFEVDNLTEKKLAVMLTGSKFTDFRKGGFILSV